MEQKGRWWFASLTYGGSYRQDGWSTIQNHRSRFLNHSKTCGLMHYLWGLEKQSDGTAHLHVLGYQKSNFSWTRKMARNWFCSRELHDSLKQGWKYGYSDIHPAGNPSTVAQYSVKHFLKGANSKSLIKHLFPKQDTPEGPESTLDTSQAPITIKEPKPLRRMWGVSRGFPWHLVQTHRPAPVAQGQTRLTSMQGAQ